MMFCGSRQRGLLEWRQRQPHKGRQLKHELWQHGLRTTKWRPMWGPQQVVQPNWMGHQHLGRRNARRSPAKNPTEMNRLSHQAEPSGRNLPHDRQMPPLRERLRSGKWRSPTPGPSHRPDDAGQSTSQSGVVKIPRLDQAVRAAGLASAKSWASKDSPPESVASNQSGGSRRSRARRGGGWRRLDTPPRFWVSCSILCTQHPWKPSPRLKPVEVNGFGEAPEPRAKGSDHNKATAEYRGTLR